MGKAILVSVYEREPMVEFFDSHEEAVKKMEEDFYRELGLPVGADYDTDNANLDIEHDTAWIDGVGISGSPLDWKVFDFVWYTYIASAMKQ